MTTIAVSHRYKLYLDDVRQLEQGWVLVKDYDAFVKMIESRGLPEEVSFDHDLERRHLPSDKSGDDAAKYLAKYCMERNVSLPKWKCHSTNEEGRRHLERVLIYTERSLPPS